ncbi:MAG: HPr family phosphocarrier protein [Spirochaetales bacterium]|nr:HPr family phosphocarrier protein [Spirochaetales bacterium]
MQTQDVTIKNRAGIHARPAAMIVQTANEFECDIYLEKDGNSINAKSIMGIITLGAGYNSLVNVKTEGSDEDKALEAIVKLFENRFEEE